MSKKKLYFVLLIFFIAATLARTQNAKAHKPDSLNLGFTSPNTLNLIISHPVDDPTSHYISSVVIQINGSTVLTESYTSQPDDNWWEYRYNTTASTNDRIEVTVTCIEGGSVSICLILGVGGCPQDGGPSIPGYLGLWVILGISVIILLTANHRKLRNTEYKASTM